MKYIYIFIKILLLWNQNEVNICWTILLLLEIIT